MTTYTKQQIAELGKSILAEIDKQFPYDEARNNQKFVIYKIVRSFLEGKKFFILEASTGFGKSVVAVTAMKVITQLFSDQLNEKGKVIPFKTLVCTKTKALQTQYSNDFPTLTSLWSASGYACNRDPFNPEAYFKSPPCDRKLCFYYNDCNFRVARQKFKSSDAGILNYAYFMNYVDHTVDLITLDEAHNLEKILVDHLHIKFNPSYLKGVLDKLEAIRFTLPSENKTIYDNMCDIVKISDDKDGWLDEIRAKARNIMFVINPILERVQDQQELIDDGNSSLSDENKKIFIHNSKIIESLASKLFRLMQSTVEWVISERDSQTSIDLKPISLTEEAETLFSRARFSVLMSATICGIPLFCKTLGIKEDEYDSVSLDSEVPVENRRIVPVNLKGMNMANKESLLPVYVNVLDSLIEKYGKEHRQLVHSVTYENAEYIKENSKFKKRMIIPETEDLIEIKNILDKNKNAILVTPAMTEGSDLSGDYCRAIYFFKIPFPYLGDKWVARKKDIDNNWYIRETINQVVQGCGRGVRSKEDYAITFILDGNFNKIRYKQDLMPRWFSNAIVEA